MRVRHILMAILLLGLTTGFAFNSWQNQMAEGNKQYLEGQFAEAASAFNQALIEAPDEPEVHYNLGNTLYAQGNYSEAKDQYMKSLEVNQDEQLSSNVKYNLGNVEYRQGEALIQENPVEALNQFEIALQQFEQVIRDNPHDEDAKYNYEFVKKKIKELKDQMEEQQQEQNQDSENSNENQEQEQQQNQNQENQDQQQDDQQNNQQQQNQQGEKQDQQNQQQQAGEDDQSANQANQSAAGEEEDSNEETENREIIGLTEEEALKLLEQFKEQNGEFIPMQPDYQNQLDHYKDW